jgi:hypothetical protein
MRTLIVCLSMCFCLFAFAAPSSPFGEFRTAVETRVAMLAGSTDKEKVSEWKWLTKSLGYIVGADVIAQGIAGPPDVANMPEYLEMSALLSKAAAGVEKSESPDVDVIGGVMDLHTWFNGFHGWLEDRFDEIAPGLPMKDQMKVSVARAKAQDGMADGEAQWANDDWGAATKYFAKALKSLAKLYLKYVD